MIVERKKCDRFYIECMHHLIGKIGLQYNINKHIKYLYKYIKRSWAWASLEDKGFQAWASPGNVGSCPVGMCPDSDTKQAVWSTSNKSTCFPLIKPI